LGFEDVRGAIEERLAANWTTTPIQWENVPFVQPSRNAAVPAWISLAIRGNREGGRASVGTTTPLRRYLYTIINQIFVPEETGTTLAYQYADTLGIVWRDVTFAAGATGTLRCFEPNAVEVGPEGSGWYQLNLITNFQRDDRFL